MDRYTLLVSLILSLLKIQPNQADMCANPRACRIAQDIITTVDAASRLPFDGDAAKEAADVLLLSVAFHESGLRESVENCSYCEQNKLACDGGRSMSMFQLMTGRAWMGHTKDEICTDNRLATKLALRWLTHFSRGGTTPMFRSYAGCPNKRVGCEAAAGLQTQFDVLARRAGLQPAPRCGPRSWRKAGPGTAAAPCTPAPAPVVPTGPPEPAVLLLGGPGRLAVQGPTAP